MSIKLFNKALTSQEPISEGLTMQSLGEGNKDFQMALGLIPQTKSYIKKMLIGYKKALKDFNNGSTRHRR